MLRPVKDGDVTLYTTLSEPSSLPDGRKVAFSVKRANPADGAHDPDGLK